MTVQKNKSNNKKLNLQNIPIDTELGINIRKAFAFENGKLNILIDYAQIEARLIAWQNTNKE